MELPSVDCEFLSLCLAAATHSFLLFSFIPYAGYMAVWLLDNENNGSNDGVNVDNVGIYAGLLGAVFPLGRLLGFVPWKMCRTWLGEKRALLLSLGLTGLVSVWFGLSRSFAEALLARMVFGMVNCVSGSVKRASINAQKNRKLANLTIESYESYESPILRCMWWGYALGPLVGGLLSDPGFLRSLFNLESSSSWYPSHPFLLPNGVSGILCWLSMLCVAVFAKNPTDVGADVVGEHRPLLSARMSRISITNIRHGHRIRDSFETLWTTNKNARLHLLAYWSFSFVLVCWEFSLPLFLITSKLGLSEGELGVLKGVAGLIVALGHVTALDNVFDIHNGTPDGMYRVLVASAMVGTLPIVLIHLALPVVENTTGEISVDFTWSSFVPVVVLVAILKIASSTYFSLIGIATGRSLRVVHKDEAARIMTMGALLFRSLAHIIAGAVVSCFMGRAPSTVMAVFPLSLLNNSSLMVWIVIGLVFGGTAASMTLVLARQSGNGVLLTEKQKLYASNRLERMVSFVSLSDSLDKAYSNATQSIYQRWNRLISFRLKLNAEAERRRSSVGQVPKDLFLYDEDEKESRPATWENHTIAPGVDFDSVSFFILGTHKKDAACAPHVLTPPIMAALQRHLPMSCKESNFWLRYSLRRDGASMHAIEAKAGLARNAVLAIETLDGDVFGCFTTKSLRHTNNRYTRCSESFLWRLKNGRQAQPGDDDEDPELKSEANGDNGILDVYSWTGDNDLCQLFADDKIAFGGGVVGNYGDGFGILLEDDLLSGSTSPCVTYGNPSLRSTTSSNSGFDDEHHFEVANIEIWGLTPFMFVADAERSEHAIQFDKENSLSQFGDGSESPSSTSAWSNFM